MLDGNPPVVHTLHGPWTEQTRPLYDIVATRPPFTIAAETPCHIPKNPVDLNALEYCFTSVGAYISKGDDLVKRGIDERVDGVGEAAYFDKRTSELTFVTGFIFVRLVVSLSSVSQDGKTSTDKTKERAALTGLAKGAKQRL